MFRVHYAIMNGDEAMFDLLENAGASCRSTVTSGNNTLLHHFFYHKINDQHGSLLKKLLDVGCDINAENNLQRTPLMLAAKLNMVNTCEMLLNGNAETEKVDFRGHRATDFAKLGSECFRLLEHVKRAQSKSQSQQHTDRIIYKKHIAPHRQLSMRTSESISHYDPNENKAKWYSSDTMCEEKTIEDQNKVKSIETRHGHEHDGKYKRQWNKLRQKKHEIRQTKQLSLQTINSVF